MQDHDENVALTLGRAVPKPLFKASILGGTGGGPISSWRWDSPDGQRFLVNTPLEEAAATPVTILLNWQTALKK